MRQLSAWFVIVTCGALLGCSPVRPDMEAVRRVRGGVMEVDAEGRYPMYRLRVGDLDEGSAAVQRFNVAGLPQRTYRFVIEVSTSSPIDKAMLSSVLPTRIKVQIRSQDGRLDKILDGSTETSQPGAWQVYSGWFHGQFTLIMSFDEYWIRPNDDIEIDIRLEPVPKPIDGINIQLVPWLAGGGSEF